MAQRKYVTQIGCAINQNWITADIEQSHEKANVFTSIGRTFFKEGCDNAQLFEQKKTGKGCPEVDLVHLVKMGAPFAD